MYLMREYYGEAASKYGQPQDKYYTLFPALDSVLPLANEGQSAIDLGCGTGVLYQTLVEKGYSYTGVDISEDMLAQARLNNPEGIFLQGDVTKEIPSIRDQFDVVITNMLFPAIGSKADFDGVFTLASLLLKSSGTMIVTSGHPCFDGYMQKHFLNRADIETKFEGYFNSGANYKVHRALGKEGFTFSDHHWTLADYYDGAEKAGLIITRINECPLVGEPPQEVIEKYAKKGCPSYIVFVIQKMP